MSRAMGGARHVSDTEDFGFAQGEYFKRAKARGVKLTKREQGIVAKYEWAADAEQIQDTATALDGLDDFFQHAPVYDGEVYRGMNFTSKSKAEEFIRDLTDQRRDPGLQSWTADWEVSVDFASGAMGGDRGKYSVLLKTQNKRGVPMASISGYHEEKEVLMPPGSKMRVVSVKKVDTARARNYDGTLHDLNKTDGLWEVTLEED